VVFAASSLKDVFRSIGAAFEDAHPGARVTFQFAGTQTLRTQIEHGAATDVFASADVDHMRALETASLVDASHVFAENEPVVVVARNVPSIVTFADLPSAERIVVGAPNVPIGRYTRRILRRAGASLGETFRSRVEARVVSRELNVRQVLAKVALGEAQAGIVYRTDAITAGDRVRIVPVPTAINVVAACAIAVTRTSPHPSLARAWVDLVLSDEGRDILGRAGFTPAGRRP
jgi:molybdate transport system substrate-binding protein